MLKAFIKKLITAEQRQQVRVAIERVSFLPIGLFAQSKILASLYYFCLNRQFGREHQSVLKGRIAYKASLSELGQSSALLRRNIHRLEKGLIMQPRKSVFASDYIAETVDIYAKAIQQKSLCSDELKWAKDVLTKYFAVVTDTPVITKAKAVFFDVNAALTHEDLDQVQSVPYPAKELPECPVSFEQLHTLYLRRRSVRWFLKTQVEPQLIRQAVNAASLAPSACNRQPYRFDLLSNPADAAAVATLAMGTTGFADQIPCLLAVVGDLSCYPAERDRHVIYIDASLAAMQLMLAFDTLGLSSCPINWPDIESRERAIAGTLNLKDYERVVMLIAVGYADPQGGIPYSQKKTDALLIRTVQLN